LATIAALAGTPHPARYKGDVQLPCLPTAGEEKNYNHGFNMCHSVVLNCFK
jgi:hypothetical protein